MKTFKILSTTQLEEYVTFTVEAESYDEALELIEEGSVDNNDDYSTRDVGGGASYKLIEEKDQ